MTDTNASDGSFLSEDEKKVWDMYVRVGVLGAEELRKELGIDEQNFRKLAPDINGQCKQYFLYRILDEIQKAGLKILEWKEYISENNPAQLQRIDYETLIDDQQFRARKLVEALVDCILFSTTDDEAHYNDYLLLHELNDYARSQEDRYEFFGFHSNNAVWAGKYLTDRVRKLEADGLNPKTRWYIKDGHILGDKWTTKGVPFSSFRDRYKKLLAVALPNELVTIGKSYVHAYGMSKDVHFTPHDTSSDFDEDEIRRGANRAGLLVLALIKRCQLLLGRVPEGINKWWSELHDTNKGPENLLSDLKKKPAEIGDVVWVRGDYAEVLSITTSKYGYFAYKVKYVGQPPLSDVPEDWFAGGEVKLVAKKEYLEQTANAVGKKILDTTGKREPHADLLDYAKKAAVRLSIAQQQLRRRRASGEASPGNENPKF